MERWEISFQLHEVSVKTTDVVEWDMHDTEPDAGQLPRKYKQLLLLSRTPASPPPLQISKKNDSLSQHLLSTLRA